MSQDEAEDGGGVTKTNAAILIAGAVVIIGGLALAWFLLPVQAWLDGFLSWQENLGVWGVVVFATVYVVATVLLAPGSPLTIGAGLIYGLWGVPIVVVAATLGAASAFLIGRHVARERVESAIEDRRIFKAIDGVVGDESWKIVGLLRLSPALPFNIQNYLFGVTTVNFWPYVIATFVGIIPGTAMFVWLGSIGATLTSDQPTTTAEWVFLGVGLLATVVVTVLVSKRAKEKLAEQGVGDD